MEEIERDGWYTPREVADAVGVHIETVRRWLRSGRLPSKRTFVGNDYKVSGADLLDRVPELNEGKPKRLPKRSPR